MADTLHGSLVLNGIDDQELVKILEIKIKHEKGLQFNPQLLTPHKNAQGQIVPPPPAPQHYDNATLIWKDQDGLEAVHKIVGMLLKKE